jgi:5,10-methylenetetrahydromethanopterin reductase
VRWRSPSGRILIEAAGDGIVGIGWVADRKGMAEKIAEAELAGCTEIIYAPSGPDVARELRAFAEAAGL